MHANRRRADRLVRATDKQNGFKAWMKLSERYDNRSPQSMLRRLQYLVKPPEVKNVKAMLPAMEQGKGLANRIWGKYTGEYYACNHHRNVHREITG